MNKYIKISLYYAILGLISGVFYREFTRMNGFEGSSQLPYVHFHTLVLGMMFFLILALFEDKFKMSKVKGFKLFSGTYHSGLHITVALFVIRGVQEVLGTDISNGFDKALSGIAGIGHILLTIGIITMLIILNKATKKLES